MLRQIPSSRNILSVVAILISISALAEGITVTTFFPQTGTSDLCPDTPLQITFNEAPYLGTSGRLRIFNAADDSVVDTIDLSVSLQQKHIGGVLYNYYPVIISGNTASIYLLASDVLSYGQTYYVLTDSGVFRNSVGVPFAGITDPMMWRFTIRAAGPAAGTTSLVVGADGSGDFCTLQGAIDFVPDDNTAPTLINVKSGIYPEIVRVPVGKDALTIQGDGRDTTRVTYANNANFNGGTDVRGLFRVAADDFTLYDITLHNTTPQGGSQAESLVFTGNRGFIQQCTLLSYQDTILATGPVYFRDCVIEGDVDFMWGSGRCFYQNCTIKCLRSSGYITQIRNNAEGNGNIYVDCMLTASPGVSGVYLSRIDPVSFPYSQVVWIDCVMGSFIHPAGWLISSGSTSNLQFWEYHSTYQSGALINVSQRHAASRQLTDKEAAFWRDPQNVLGWVPVPILRMASNPFPANKEIDLGMETALSWSAGLDFDADTGDVHEVYLAAGSLESDLPESPTVTLSSASYEPMLEYDTQYVWRVDEVIDGVTYPGSVWTFTILEPIALAPNPNNGQINVPLNQILSWQAGQGYDPNTTDEHQVYFALGSSQSDLPSIPTATVKSAVFDPNLQWLSQYVWRVDEIIDGTRYPGDVWSFTTGSLPGAVGHWTLDDGSGVVATDSTDNRFDALLSDGSDWTAGLFDGALLYSLDALPTLAEPHLISVDELSFSAWFNHAETSSHQFFGVGINNGINEWYIYRYGGYGHIQIDTPSDSSNTWYTGVTPSDNQWHHLVVIFDRTARTIRLYLDGVRRAQTVKSAMGPKTLYQLEWGEGMNGIMDDIQIYDKVLTAQDVAGLYLCGEIPSLADINGDCIVDLTDLSQMAVEWLMDVNPACDPPLAGDTNGDCVVDMTDLAQLAADWLICRHISGNCP